MPNPVEKPRVTQPWGKPNKRYKAGRHTGIDYGMPVGTPMLAVAEPRPSVISRLTTVLLN